MHAGIRFFIEHLPALAVPALVLVSVVLCGLLVRRWVFRAFKQWALTTATPVDDIVVRALYGPFLLWVLIAGLHLAVQISTLPDPAAHWIAKLLLILWVASFTIVASRLAVGLVRCLGGRVEGPLPVTTLSQNLARLATIILGGVLMLNVLGISVTPILTALGVGGIAVALALQDTLANLFSGFYISLAGQIRVGQYIKLASGEEGYVADISWRCTTVRALANNLIIIPNLKLSQAIVTNYHLPEKRMSVLIPIGVSYDCDPELVESILVEEALCASRDVPGLLSEPAPFVRFIPGFGDSSLNFTLIVQVAEFVDQYLAQHEIRKRVLKRFRKENISIPFPQRDLHVIPPPLVENARWHELAKAAASGADSASAPTS